MIFPLKNSYEGESLEVPKAIRTSRISWVDHARGFAIMLIVYRHVVVGMKRSGLGVSDTMYGMQEIFFNFRMPVFFVLSGVFIANSLRKRSRWEVSKERSSTLLYPYLLCAVIMISMQILFSGYTNSKREWWQLINILVQPRGVDHLWYLFALFNTTMLYLVISKYLKNGWVHAVLAMALHIITFMPFLQGNSLLSDMFYFYPYFLLGIFLSPALLDSERADALLNAKNLLWLLPLFLVGQWFWFVHRDEEKTWYLLFFVINLVACYVVYIGAYLISQRSGSDWLSYLGKHSLYIYILHVPLAAGVRSLALHFDGNIDPWLLLAICWIVGLVVPVVLYNLLKPYGFDRLFSLKPKSAP